jgi:hypothetical protein
MAAHFFRGNCGYALLVALVYLLLGAPNAIVIRLINCMFSALLPALCFLIVQAVYDNKKTARSSAVWAALFPDFIVLASLQYKDAIEMSLTLFILWCALRINEQMTIWRAFPLFAAMLLQATFRIPTTTVLLALIIIQFIFNKGTKALPFLCTAAVLGLGFGIVASMHGSHSWYFLDLAKVHESSMNLLKTAVSRSGDSSSLAATASGKGMAALLMLNLGLFIVAPLPGRELDLFTPLLLGTWLWYILIPAVFFGLIYSIRHKPGKSWLLYAFAILTSFLIIGTFLAANTRYREELMPLFLIFALVGRTYCSEKIKRAYPWYLLCVSIGILTYLLLKVYA